ncbi:MAG TPA: trigger factor [Candidatus Pristimantibacillus sp.]|jgi:trigger factor|nr:trigger factor [Candidatus Pristimantibacillus sp.]
MHVTKKYSSDTKVTLTLTADAELLEAEKKKVLLELARNLKIQGFREGKAPLNIVEKSVDPSRLQTEFLEHAVNRLYLAALDHENLRPVTPPEVKIAKFVPFDTLEVEAEVEVVGEVKLADYKKIKLAKEKVTVDAKEVDEVIASLRSREAEKKEANRAAKDKDEVVIDFKGVDAKTKEEIKGADGKGYPLLLGSNTFIPGFEANLLGMKAGEEKTFVLTFPKDYGVKALQNRKVEFAVKVEKVQEVVEPKLDDAFAATVGPFKTVADLKVDIKKELSARKEDEAEQKFADELITKIAEKSKVAIPEVLITEQIDRLEQEQRQNLMYRGQTWQEFLDAEGLTDETFRKQLRPGAELRVKAGLVLSEISELEKIDVTPEELEIQVQTLKARYPDPQMQAELAKPEARRTIASRILTDKTVAKLKEYATK